MDGIFIQYEGVLMDVEKLAKVLLIAHKHDLDAIDIEFLAEVIRRNKVSGEVNAAEFGGGTTLASFGTLNKRLKKLLSKGFLVRRGIEKDQRLKFLEEGPELQKFVDEMNNQ
jgi:hypothetical protein